jgi:hypothetical protein
MLQFSDRALDRQRQEPFAETGKLAVGLNSPAKRIPLVQTRVPIGRAGPLAQKSY